jgi:hypothetical protein
MSIQEVTEGNDVWLVARVVKADNIQLSQADLPSGADVLTVRVYDATRESLATGANGREVLSNSFSQAQAASYILPADSLTNLTNDGYWNGTDDQGYNFLFQLKVTNLDGGSEGVDWVELEAGHRYRVEFSVKTTSDGYIRWPFLLYVRSMLSV